MDYVQVERIATVICEQWHDDIPGTPECHLDASLEQCALLCRGKASAVASNLESLIIESSCIDGFDTPGDWWDHILRCTPEEAVRADAIVRGTRCLLLVYGGLEDGAFSCECVHKGPGCPRPAAPETLWQRVVDWCQTVVTLGQTLQARRVTLDHHDGRVILMENEA